MKLIVDDATSLEVQEKVSCTFTFHPFDDSRKVQCTFDRWSSSYRRCTQRSVSDDVDIVLSVRVGIMGWRAEA
jgi:hypothetical protein